MSCALACRHVLLAEMSGMLNLSLILCNYSAVCLQVCLNGRVCYNHSGCSVSRFWGRNLRSLERGTQKLHQFQTKSKLQLCTQCNPSPLFNIEGRGGAGESSVCCIKCYVEDVEQTPHIHISLTAAA